MARHRLITGFFLSLLFVNMLAGCAQSPAKRFLWPSPPLTPRIEWLGTFASQDDFPKSGRQKFLEMILGRPTPEYFKFPFGIVKDSRGVIYVADNAAHKLLVYDVAAQTVESYSNDPIFSRPAGLAVDSADNLYVVDAEIGSVFIFDKNRRPRRTIGARDELRSPAYICIDQERGRIYVSDPRSNRIVIYDRFGKKISEIGPQAKMDNGVFHLASPQGMAIDKAGNLFVAELLGARISVFDSEGKYLRSFGERGDAVYQFEAPKDLAFDSDGNLWVADTRRAQIYTYTPEGKLLLVTGGAGATSDPLGFSMPTAIFIAPDDTIYVTDRVNRRFSVWRYLSKDYLREHPSPDKEQNDIQPVGSSAGAAPQ